MMASKCNPVGYIVDRQYNDTIVVKNKLFKERLNRARNLYRKDLLGHYGCVNAIEFSDEGELLISGGDDRRVLLWSIPEAIFDKGTAITMETRHFSNIFCLSFDSTNSKIFSGGNDDQVLVHDAKTGHIVRKLPHVKPVYGLSVNPENDSVLATAGDDGRILICDIREPNGDSLILAKQKMGFHSVKYNPMNAKLLVTANSEEGIALWDMRKSREVYIHYDGQAGPVSGISACFNSDGSRVLALRRRLPPALYASHASASLCQFYHPHYYNSCTMKTCAFAGDSDDYVLSGSDDFNLYMWKVPDENVEWGTSHLVLNGHRSIVNQVRYNKQCNLIASSGVEKMVKLWSSLPIGTWSGALQSPYSDTDRPVYSHDEYIYLVGGSSSAPIQQQPTSDQSAQPQPQPQQQQQQQQQQRITHDYSEHSTQEDARMMAFFDSLIQREIEGWESRSEDTFTSDSDSDTFIQEKIRLSWQSLLQGRKIAEENTRKYKPNRIAQLIAQKRNRLAKMAHSKSKTLVQRLSTRVKHNKRTNKHIHKFRPKSTRQTAMYRTTPTPSTPSTRPNQRTTNGSSASQSAAGSATTNSNKRLRHLARHTVNNNNQSRAGADRQRERHLLDMLESMPDHKSGTSSSTSSSSSNKENAGGDIEFGPGFSGGGKKRLKRSETDRNLREECNMSNSYRDEQQQQHIIDMPSTSTGITSSSSHSHVRFRHGANASALYDDSDDDTLVAPRCSRNGTDGTRQQEDGEEDQGQLVNILPTPLNGTHNVYVNVMLEVSANENAGNVVSVGTNTDLQSSDSDTDSFEDLSYISTQLPDRPLNRHKTTIGKTNQMLQHCKGKGIDNKGRGKASNHSINKHKQKLSSNFKRQHCKTTNGRQFKTADDLSTTTTNSSTSSTSSTTTSSNSNSTTNSSNDEDEEEPIINNNLSMIMNDFVENGGGNGDGRTVTIDGDDNMVTPIKRTPMKTKNKNPSTSIDSVFALASSSTTAPSSRFYRKRRYERDSNSDDDLSPMNKISDSSSGNNSDSSDSSNSAAPVTVATSSGASYYQRLRKQRAKKARLNLRKQMHINGDSDSN